MNYKIGLLILLASVLGHLSSIQSQARNYMWYGYTGFGSGQPQPIPANSTAMVYPVDGYGAGSDYRLYATFERPC